MFTPHYEAVRKRLVAMRERAGLTQRDLAGRLKKPRSFVSRIEQGERRLDLLEFYRVCLACKASPSRETSGLIGNFRKLDRKK